MNPMKDRELYYRENQEYIDNNCMNFPLTLDFLRENEERIDWIWAIEQMEMSVEFLNEMIEYIPFGGMTLKAFNNLPEPFIKRNWNRMIWAYEIREGIKYGHIKAPEYD